MFEYIKLHNFKSFGDVTVNFLDRKGNPKNLILVYGENGIGKSNLTSAFCFLSETLRTMNVRDILDSILLENPEKLEDESFARFFKMRYRDIETLIRENKMVSSRGNMSIEYGFKLNGKHGKYFIETNDTLIIHERLEYTLIKNKGVYFDITTSSMSISEKIVDDSSAYFDLKQACTKFWGKHTFMSIVAHELDDKSDLFFRKNLAKNFRLVMDFLDKMSCKVNFGSRQERGILGHPSNMLSRYDSGEISVDEESNLDKAEGMLNFFLTTTFRDVKKAYYKKKRDNEFINYNLMLKKVIAGKTREIDFSFESTGTQSLLQLLPFLLVVTVGSTVIIDEFDTGIHDILVRDLVTSLKQSINGQLIMTTHNTLLMESAISKDNIFVINETENGQKEIECITHYDSKIHPNTNMRSQYIIGTYHGVPDDVDIDFQSLLHSLD